MAEEPIIEVKGLWKRYGLPPFLPWKKRDVADHEWALRDISFSVPRGGSLGILGRNGAGKSTLLKLLAGVTPPDKGSIKIRGKIFSMIELAAGMSTELSGLENIRILGTIMGLNSREIEEIIPEVKDFSELGDWLHKPVWQYSSGMMARLGFGIAANIQADIIIIDEVLAVGDILFQRKCQQKIEKMLLNGTTLILVTHNPYQMELMCNQGILLDSGTCISNAQASSVAKQFMRLMNSVNTFGNILSDLDDPSAREGSGDIRVENIKIVSQKNREEISQIIAGCSFIICISLIIKKKISLASIFVRLFDVNNTLLYGIKRIIEVSDKHVGEIIDLECLFEDFPLHGGVYTISIKITDGIMMDFIRNGPVISSVLAEQKALTVQGILDLNTTWIK